MVRVILIGAGYWGRNWLRELRKTDTVKLVGVVDPAIAGPEDLGLTPQDGVTCYSSLATVDVAVDAAIIATPASTHYAIVSTLVLKGPRVEHVLLEKPATTNTKEMHRLASLVVGANLHVMVGHTYLHNEALQQVANATFLPNFGQLVTLHTKRTNWGPVRPDVAVHWDLAPHDVSMVLHTMDMHQASLIGVQAQRGGPGTTFIHMTFRADDGRLLYAHAHVSWEEPNKERRVVFVGQHAKLELDDVRNSCQPAVYNRYDANGDIAFINVGAHPSPLRSELTTFLHRCTMLTPAERHKATMGELDFALRVVDVLERVDGCLATANSIKHV